MRMGTTTASALRTRWARNATLLAAIMVVIGGGFAAPAVAEPGDFRSAGANGVDGEYIVAFANETSFSVRSAVAADVAKEYRAKVGKTFRSAFNGFTARMSEAQARRMAADPRVEFVAQDQWLSPQEEVPWHMDRIDQRDPSALDGRYLPQGPSGAGVTIYVLDSGINQNHVEFGGRVVHREDFVREGGVEDPSDCSGHGTAVASAAAGETIGIARDAQIVSLKIAGCSGQTRTAYQLAAVDWLMTHRVPLSIVNMSYDAIYLLEQPVRDLVEFGVAFFKSAGNENQYACEADRFSWMPEVITVAATDQSDQRSSFSNYGDCVDIFAPGTQIRTADHSRDYGYLNKNGTSHSAPMAAGAAAVLYGRDVTMTPAQLRARLRAEGNYQAVGDSKSPAASNVLLHTGGYYRSDPEKAIPDDGSTHAIRWVLNQGDPTAHKALRVGVRIMHPNRGQLKVELKKVFGPTYRLYSPNSDTRSNLIREFVVNASDTSPNGRWLLKVTDTKTGETGFWENWTMQF